MQFTSGIFSIASHSVLQYFPSVTWQVQIGCAHFLAAIVFFSLVERFDEFTALGVANCKLP